MRKFCNIKKSCFLIISLWFLGACNNDFVDNDSINRDDQQWEIISPILFDATFASETIILNSCMKEKNVRSYDILYIEEDSEIPLMKTRSEDGGSTGGSTGSSNSKPWIKYGEVCGLISAKKFNDEMQKKYKDQCYEMRAEPMENGCRMMYHRAC